MRPGEAPTPSFESDGPDAGNGSLMRLAPVALFHCTNSERASEDAKASSYTTHPGPIAAEACAFLAHLLVRCIRDYEGSDAAAYGARTFLCAVADEYAAQLALSRADEPGVAELCIAQVRLLQVGLVQD